MTVSATTSRADYTGNGSTTAFAVPFYFLDNTHLLVLKTVGSTTTTLALTTDYTVTGAGVSSGGTVTCVVAPASGAKLSILRNVPLDQQTHYVPNDPFPAASHENALDKLTMVTQQLNEAIGRALALSQSSTGVSTTLPNPTALNIIGWNSGATALQNYDVATIMQVAGSSGFSFNTFSGNGSTTSFTLSGTPGAVANCNVYISGVRQTPTTDYSVSNTTLTFTSAPPSGTNNILVEWGTTLGIGIPSDTSVTTAKIADGAVTTAKIADGAVTSGKLASGAAVANIGYTPANDTAVAHLAGAETFTAAKRGAVVALTDGATITPDFSAGNNYSVTLGGNRTLANPTNIVAGQSGVISITQDGTGSRTLSFGSYFKFASGAAPTLTTTAAAVDLIAYYVESATRIDARFIGDVK